MTVEKISIIKKPVSEVWKAFCDVNAWGSIFPDVVEAKIDGELKPGKMFYMKLKGTVPFLPLSVNPIVIKIEHNKKQTAAQSASYAIRWKGSGKFGITGIHDFTFEPFGRRTKGTSYGSTKVVSNEVFSGRFVFLARLLKSRVEKTFELHLEGLKHYVEGK